jgi:prepilin-type N-terminal cleavage/methylation domain-containing protein
MTFRRQSGFSILELLIVLAIVGILASVAIYALGVSRATSRDSKRVSDVSVLRSSLSQYWLQMARYPVSDGVDLGVPGGPAVGLTTEGFVGQQGGGSVILPSLPIGPSSGEYYVYKGTNNGYSLMFTTERATAYGPAGTYFAHASGVDQQDVEK